MKQATEDKSNFQAAPKRFVLKDLYANNQRFILSICSLCVFFSLWELIGQSGLINPLFTSSPSRITREAERVFFQTGEMWQNLRLSGFEYATGLSLAIIVGVLVGVLIGWYKTLESLFDVYITALYATPQVAFTSLLIIWFGIGVLPKIVLIFLMCFFPIVINTIAGIKHIDSDYLRVAKSFNARESQIFTTIALPSAVPFILTGIRLAIGRGLIGVLMGEMFMANAGVGYYITTSGSAFNTSGVFVGVAIFALTGITLTELIRRIEKRVEAWRA